MRLQYRTQRLHSATEQHNAPTVHFSREDNETRKKPEKRPGQTTKKIQNEDPHLNVLSDARRQEIRINALSEVKRNEIDKVFYKESITCLTFFKTSFVSIYKNCYKIWIEAIRAKSRPERLKCKCSHLVNEFANAVLLPWQSLCFVFLNRKQNLHKKATKLGENFPGKEDKRTMTYS